MDRPPALIDPKTGEEKEDETLLKERPYQQKMKEICIEKNTIIYLPTGEFCEIFFFLLLIKFLF